MKFFFIIALCLYNCDSSYTEDCKFAPALDKTFEQRESARIKTFASDAKEFCRLNGFNTKIFFLIDMSVHSGKRRFFICDMQADSVAGSSLVAHGACGNSFSYDPVFSNQSGCGCTSLGKYKIGSKYNGRFGAAYKLHGLDSSNSNAYQRCVVLHGYYEVPDYETFPQAICNSLGCPMVSPVFLKQLEIKIDASSKPVLLWIVN